jgi:two-component system sensor histidine kinase PilS (NtrC family)
LAACARESTGAVAALAARAVATLGLLALVRLLQMRGAGGFSPRELCALHLLLAFAGGWAFLQTALLARGWWPRPRVVLELSGDGALIAALVYCTGGVRSVFAFLYMIWIVHAAVRAGATGALCAAGASVIATAALGMGAVQGWLPSFEPGASRELREVWAALGTQGAASLAVALLSRGLARRVRQGEQELRELGELHGRIFDHVASGLLTVDADHAISSFNPEAERITGYAAEEVIGRPLGALFPELDLRDPGLARASCRIRNRAGDELRLGLSRSWLCDEGGRPEGAIVIFQDLTQITAMEEELRRRERLSAVGQLAAGLAHEIRNPLASLSGAIELLGRDRRPADAASRRLLRIVQRETERLNRLVSSFLSYARAESVRGQPVALAELFAELGELLRQGDHRDLRVECDVPAELAAKGDADRLRQVFWNLLLNAAESRPVDHTVRVRARRLPELLDGVPALEIEIVDRGEGIAPEARERIFEPFFTTKPKGTGLGLATVHRVVEAHQGELELQSEPGRGTTVRIRLPRADCA